MKLLLVVLVGLVFSPLAMAKDKACEKDIAAFCSDVKRGGGAVMKCLHENREKLSPECRDHRERTKKALKGVMKKHRSALREACAADIEKLCGEETKPRKKSPLGCLREKQTELSEACRNEIDKGPRGHGKKAKKSVK